MILSGTIHNKLINGANGTFSVGKLHSPLGQFSIKSTLLDQFDEGEYQGNVSVTNIRLNTYTARSGFVITEILLEIDALDMDQADIKAIDDEPIEPDASVDPGPAAVKTTAQRKPPATSTPAPPAEVSAATTIPAAQSNDDQSLFGLLWPLSDTVRLDSTVSRPQFIKQKDRLLELGYRFDPASQAFSKQQAA